MAESKVPLYLKWNGTDSIASGGTVSIPSALCQLLIVFRNHSSFSVAAAWICTEVGCFKFLDAGQRTNVVQVTREGSTIKIQNNNAVAVYANYI